MKKRDGGFTFIEILVSLVIIVVLAVMTKSIINYYGGMQNEILAKRANIQLVGFLERWQGKLSDSAPSLQELSASSQYFETVTLNSGERMITGELTYEPIRLIDSKKTKKIIDYMVIEGKINWVDYSGRYREIKMTAPAFRTKE